MKKILVLAAALVGFAAKADVAAPLYGCQLEGTVSGWSVGVKLAATVLTGEGTVTCEAVNGVSVRSKQPVMIEIAGAGVGLGFSRYQNIKIVSGVVGVANESGLIGHFSIGASVGATLINVAPEAGLFWRLSNAGLGFEVALSGGDAKGLGAYVQVKGMNIMTPEQYAQRATQPYPSEVGGD